MEILSDTTFKGEVNFKKNVTFGTGAVLEFYGPRGSDNTQTFLSHDTLRTTEIVGDHVHASEFIYGEGGCLTATNADGRVQYFWLPHYSQITCTQFTNNQVALIANIPQAAKLCGFIKAGDSGCVFSHKEYTLSSAIAADCTLFSVNTFGVSSKDYVADVELYKK